MANIKMILEYTDYAPDGIDLSKLNKDKEVSIEELLSDEALHTNFLDNKELQQYVLDHADPSDVMFSNLYGHNNTYNYAFEDLNKEKQINDKKRNFTN